MQRYFAVSPPSVHQMVLTLERRRALRREARSGCDLVLRSVPEPWPFPSQLRVVAELVAAVDLADGPTAALEVLAIVAYEQPVSRADVAHIRGPDSAGVIDTTARLQADRRRCPLWPHSAYTVVTVWAAASSRWP